MDLQEGIRRIVRYGDSILGAMHIAFGIDRYYVAPMGVMMTSIVETNKEKNFTFHIFVDFLLDADMKKLQKFSCEYAISIFIYFIDVSELEKNLELKWKTVYDRFLVSRCLPDDVKRVLYIDSDMICNGNILELESMQFDGYTVMVVQDQGKVDKYIKELNLQHGNYFNAGMLYMDRLAWNRERISEQALDLLRIRKLFLYDQDALNILLDGKVKYLSTVWNSMCNMEKRRSKIDKDAVIIHYASIVKPWYIWCIHPARNLWMKYYEISLWKDFEFRKNPCNYREMRSMCMYKLHTRKYYEAFIWFLRYYKQRKIEKNRH